MAPRRMRVIVTRAVTVRMELDTDNENDARVRSDEGEAVADSDLLRSTCEALTDRDARVGSLDGVSVAVDSRVIFDNVYVRIEGVRSSVTVNVDDSKFVNVPSVELTDVVGDIRRVRLWRRADIVSVNVDVFAVGVKSRDAVVVSVVVALVSHDPCVRDPVTLFVFMSDSVASERDVVDDTDTVPVVVMLSSNVKVFVVSCEAEMPVNVSLDVGERYSENVYVRLAIPAVGDMLRFMRCDNVRVMVNVMVSAFRCFFGRTVEVRLAEIDRADALISCVNVCSERDSEMVTRVCVLTSVRLSVLVGVIRTVRVVVSRMVAVPVSVAVVTRDSLSDMETDLEGPSGENVGVFDCDDDHEASSVTTRVPEGVLVDVRVCSFVSDGVNSDGVMVPVLVSVIDSVMVTVSVSVKVPRAAAPLSVASPLNVWLRDALSSLETVIVPDSVISVVLL